MPTVPETPLPTVLLRWLNLTLLSYPICLHPLLHLLTIHLHTGHVTVRYGAQLPPHNTLLLFPHHTHTAQHTQPLFTGRPLPIHHCLVQTGQTYDRDTTALRQCPLTPLHNKYDRLAVPVCSHNSLSRNASTTLGNNSQLCMLEKNAPK